MHINFIVQFLQWFQLDKTFFLERVLDIFVIVPTWLLNYLAPLMHHIVCLPCPNSYIEVLTFIISECDYIWGI